LAGLPSRLGVGAGALRLDAVRLHLRGRLLGLRDRAARPALRPGVHRAPLPADAGLVLPPLLRRPRPVPARCPVHPPGLRLLLLRRLLRHLFGAARFRGLVRLPHRRLLLRPAVLLLPPPLPRLPGLGARPAWAVRRPPGGAGGPAAADAGAA